jgi:hypothetical protein
MSSRGEIHQRGTMMAEREMCSAQASPQAVTSSPSGQQTIRLASRARARSLSVERQRSAGSGRREEALTAIDMGQGWT